jgi:uncharacterized membrane protein (DUF2068 family)
MAEPEISLVRPASDPASPAPQAPGSTILVIIGVFKLAKAILLLLLGLIALHLVHSNLANVITESAQYLHMDPKGRWLNWVLSHTLSLSPGRLRDLGVALFIYSALFLTEGVGLVLRQHWAEYFTTITTGLFIPVELYEIGHRIWERHRISPAPLYLTAINIAIVVYLIVRLRREALRRRRQGPRAGFPLS